MNHWMINYYFKKQIINIYLNEIKQSCMNRYPWTWMNKRKNGLVINHRKTEIGLDNTYFILSNHTHNTQEYETS